MSHTFPCFHLTHPRKACLLGFVGLCLAVALSVICSNHIPPLRLEWKPISCCPTDIKVAFELNLQISKNDMGIYEVFLRDDRGKDKSTFNLTDAGTFSSRVENCAR